MMDHRTFMDEMLKPSFVWTMASGMLRSSDQHAGRTDQGAEKRKQNAQEKIDQLVLLRAEAIKDEQRTAMWDGEKS